MTHEKLSAERLLPCPFCGSEALSGTTLDGAGYAMCKSDECWGMAGYLPTEAEARIAWNRRAPAELALSVVEPKVKALEWRKFDSDRRAYTGVGEYSVGQVGNQWLAILRHYDEEGDDRDDVLARCADKDRAQAAAQVDYERRILSALEGSKP